MPTLNRPLFRRTQGGSSPTAMRRDIAHDYRRHVGLVIAQARLTAGLTQAQLGEALDVGFTTISAIEVGRSSVPPERYEAMADALEMDHEGFARLMLRYSNPWCYKMLFWKDLTPKQRKELNEELEELPDRSGGPAHKRR